MWGYSSVGRAPALQAGGRRFESVYLHQKPKPTQDGVWPPFLDSSAVEHPAVNRRVVGSNPTRGASAPIAQSAERIHGKDEVIGSNPIGSSIETTLCCHCGPMVKRLRHRPFTAVTGVRIPLGSPPYGSVAQSVEQRTENPRVGGSIPSRATKQLVLSCTCLRKWLRGRASPCQGEGRGFESRLPLHMRV
jgi:hypothetical protein